MLRITDVIAHKRDGRELSRAEIEGVVASCAHGDIPDYQVAAWLMAVYLRGLSLRETFDLAEAMAYSGRVLDWGPPPPFVVDKHSTGGIGDKTSLALVPLVAAAGVPVAKMSGRGLGFTGGTLDKLEAIPGFKVRLSVERFQAQVRSLGLAIVAQSPELAPADGKLYALRDATATVESLPLVASSVMSKKIAGGAHGIVLDVKMGCGAFARTAGEAERLASLMIEIGRRAGRGVRAVISSMDQPLGTHVGNSLEIREAVQLLRGRGPSDLRDLVFALGQQMLLLAGRVDDEDMAQKWLQEALSSGRAYEKLLALVAAQGGDQSVIEDPDLLPRAPVVRTVPSPESGFVSAIDGRTIGETVVALGGGRLTKEDEIDHAVGIVLLAKRGSPVGAGDPLFEVHARTERGADEATRQALPAFAWARERPEERPLVIETLSEPKGMSS